MTAVVIFSSPQASKQSKFQIFFHVCLLYRHKVETMVMETFEKDACELKEIKNFKDKINQNQAPRHRKGSNSIDL